MNLFFWNRRDKYSADVRRLMDLITALDTKLSTIITNQEKEMSEIDDLNTAMSNITTAVSGAVTDIQTLSAQLAAQGQNPDPAAIEAAVTQLNTLATNLNNAVTPPAPASAPAAA